MWQKLNFFNKKHVSGLYLKHFTTLFRIHTIHIFFKKLIKLELNILIFLHCSPTKESNLYRSANGFYESQFS